MSLQLIRAKRRKTNPALDQILLPLPLASHTARSALERCRGRRVTSRAAELTSRLPGIHEHHPHQVKENIPRNRLVPSSVFLSRPSQWAAEDAFNLVKGEKGGGASCYVENHSLNLTRHLPLRFFFHSKLLILKNALA